MADIRDIENEIRKGKNLEQNLPVYINAMASVYGEFAFYNLAMSLSMQLDKDMYEDSKLHVKNTELYSVLLEVIKKLAADELNTEENDTAIQQVLSVRENIRHRMEALTANVDDLVIREYMLNRLEPRFELISKEDTSNDDLAREILRWIFQDEENALINERIKTAISCLPIRLTKGKILDLVDTTFTLYRGSDKKAIDMFDYMLRSASGMYEIDKKYDAYDNLNELLNELRNADYENLTPQKYFDLKDDYRLASNLVTDLSDELTDLEDLANNLLAVLLTRQYFTLEAMNKCKKVAEIISRMLEGSADYDEIFNGTENRVESLNERISEESSVLIVIRENYMKQVGELMLTVPFGRLGMTERLCGDSTFAELIDAPSEIDENYLEDVRSRFAGDLEAILKISPRLKRRAIMAQLLRELPVMLSTHNEVMEYVRQALDSCTDMDERQISVNLIRENYD